MQFYNICLIFEYIHMFFKSFNAAVCSLKVSKINFLIFAIVYKSKCVLPDFHLSGYFSYYLTFRYLF